MAWSVGRATWVGDVTDPDIAQQVGSRTFDRGEAYAAERRVRSLASRADGLMLLATVDGSRSSTYQTIVEAREHPRGRSHLWSGRCSCPVAVDCKHVVALLLVARDVAHGITPDGGSQTSDAPAPAPDHWADVLGHVRPRAAPTEPEAPVRPEAHGDLVPAGLYVDTVYRSPSGWGGVPELGYGLRPTRRTRAGTWHRKLSWQEALPRWRAGLRYLPEHEEIMAALRDAARPGSGGVTSSLGSPTLALEASPDVWAHLRRAQEAGIELLPGEGVSGPVTVLADAARLVLHVLRATDESGDLSVRVDIEGLPDDLAGERLLIGDPVHGLAFEDEEGALTFLPLEQDLELGRGALLRAEAGLRVPADERARFLRTAVPGLRQRVRVRSEVPLPVPDDAAGGTGAGGTGAGGAPVGPVVTVLVTVSADVPGEVRLELGHAYDGRARTFSTPRFTGAGARDRTAEAAAVAAATSVLAIPGATRLDVTDSPYLVTAVVLRGLDAARFVTDLLPALEADDHVTVVVDGELPAFEEVTAAPVIRLGTTDVDGPSRAGAPGAQREGRGEGGGDWFDLHVSIEVDGEEVPFEPLFAAIAAGDDIMMLDSGSWFRLDRPELLRLRALIEEARELSDPDAKELRLSAHHADLWDELVSLGVVDEQSARWTASIGALGAAVDDGPPEPVPADLRATLRPYQVDGYRWLSRLWDARLGGILADDMGLGKTLQTIAVLVRAHDRGELGDGPTWHGPVLVVAPTSVVGTWLGEFETFAPHLPVVAVGATERKRGTALAEAVAGAEVVITSYAVLRLDVAAFQGMRWGGVVLDEAQFVKNRQAKTHIAVRRLGAPFTVAVTGTPLENSLMDLWSLLSPHRPGPLPAARRLHQELPQADRVGGAARAARPAPAPDPAAHAPADEGAGRDRPAAQAGPGATRAAAPRARPHLRPAPPAGAPAGPRPARRSRGQPRGHPRGPDPTAAAGTRPRPRRRGLRRSAQRPPRSTSSSSS